MQQDGRVEQINLTHTRLLPQWLDNGVKVELIA
jgi:hypothetical protein